ncbi:hypothetical protein [Duganella sp. Dugasp56]|uniref:hypothetical protein n=1 Tax=Duganella sp. Dugasp56 TaxID=3243046 RepID=UPI0039B0BC42
MYNLFGRERLKLVTQGKAEPLIKKGDSEQLTFDFKESPEVILLMEENFKEVGFFGALVERLHPCFIFDTRTTPRLDFIAATRVQAFAQLQHVNLKYMDLHESMEANYASESDSADAWIALAIDALEKSSCRRGPCLFIFDDDFVFKKSKKTISEKFIKAGKLSKNDALLAGELHF